MAFKGGFLVKPTTTNTQNLANLLIQGTQAIEEKKLKINESASKLMSEFNKSMADMPITGPADYNVFISKTSDAIRNYTGNLYQKFQRGEIGISDLNIGMSKVTGQATMLANSQEVSAKQNEDLQKGIDDGKYSGINSVLNFGIFRAAATGDNNESVLNTTVDEFGDIQLSYSYLMPTLEGPKSMTKTASLSNRLSPATGFVPYKAVDLANDIKTFKSNLGSSGLVTTETQVLEDGRSVDIVKIDQSNDPKVKSAVESAIDAYDDNSLVDIAYKFGMKVDLDPSYKPYSEKRILSKFGNDPLFSESGETISISSEDMLLETLDNGIKVNLTEKQKDILKAKIRKDLYNSIGITDQRFFINRPVDSGKAANKAKALNAELSSASSTLGGTPQNVEARDALGDSILNQWAEFQKLADGQPEADLPAEMKNMALPKLEGSSTRSAISMPNEVGNVLLDALLPTSFTGQKLNSISNMYSQKREVDGEITYRTVLVGSSNLGSIERGRKATADENYKTARVTKTIQNSVTKPQTTSNEQLIYQTLWDTNLAWRRAAETATPPLTRNSRNYGMAIHVTMENIK